MTFAGRSLACVVVLFALSCVWAMGTSGTTGTTGTTVLAQGPDLGTDAQRESGKTLYSKYCVQCHGEKGDGDGYATQHLIPRPRDFTTGKFKVRTTPNGALPTHQDLVNIIRRGMPYTSMPGWPTLSDSEVSESRLLPQVLLPRFRGRRECPQAHGTSERAGGVERVH